MTVKKMKMRRERACSDQLNTVHDYSGDDSYIVLFFKTLKYYLSSSI